MTKSDGTGHSYEPTMSIYVEESYQDLSSSSKYVPLWPCEKEGIEKATRLSLMFGVLLELRAVILSTINPMYMKLGGFWSPFHASRLFCFLFVPWSCMPLDNNIDKLMCIIHTSGMYVIVKPKNSN